MQLSDLTPQIAPLPEPGLVERLTLESPGGVVVSLVVIGLAGAVILNARGRLKLGLIVLAVAWALAGASFFIASTVQTPREALMARTRELVRALAEVDSGAMGEILSPDAVVEVRRVKTFRGRESIIRAAEMYVGGSTRIESHRAPEIQAVIDGANAARTQARVRHSGPGIPPASWWRIEWYRPSEGEPWVAVEVKPLWIAGFASFEG